MAPVLEIVGGGRMGGALVGGLVASGFAAPDQLVVVEPSASRRAELEAEHPGLVVTESPVPAGDVVLATKPDIVVTAAASVAAAGCTRVLSIAAGVRVAAIEAALTAGTPVVRAMPNTPALVGEGAAAVAAGTSASDADLEWAESVLGSVGRVVRTSEDLLDAVTGLSGSGPAYVYLVVEALIDAGVLNGLTRDVAETLAIQTVFGAAQLLRTTGQAPADARAAVTSPGGTTAAGLRVLEERGVRSALLEAVSAATSRSRELGSS